MADRVAVMRDGLILQLGTPTEVYERPRTRFVSEFLGTSNLFRCDVLGGDGEGRYRLALPAGGGEPIRFSAAADPGVGGAAPAGGVTVAIRPEKMELAREPPSGTVAARGEVVDHVFRGTYHAYQARIDGRDDPVFVYQQARHSEGRDLFAVGEAVYVAWHADNAVVLRYD